MEVALKKMGNNTALVIPAPVLRSLGIGAGQLLTLDTTADGRIVLTPKRKYGLVAPITQGGDFARYAGFAVTLTGTGCKTQGVALVNKIRMLDLEARKAKKIERAPKAVIEDAIGRLTALLD